MTSVLSRCQQLTNTAMIGDPITGREIRQRESRVGQRIYVPSPTLRAAILHLYKWLLLPPSYHNNQKLTCPHPPQRSIVPTPRPTAKPRGHLKKEQTLSLFVAPIVHENIALLGNPGSTESSIQTVEIEERLIFLAKFAHSIRGVESRMFFDWRSRNVIRT